MTVTIPESMELSKAMNDIFGLPDDGKSTGQTFLQSMESIEVLEESLHDEAEKEAHSKQLMDFYKKLPFQIDMPVTQEWLEKHYGHLVLPPPPSSPLEPYSPPPVTQADPIQKLMAEVTQEKREKANADYINGGVLPCPFHPCPCPCPNCCVWLTSETYGIVLDVLQSITNKKLLPLYQDTSLRCECNLVPDMKLSNSEKNYHKVYLCCGRKNKSRGAATFSLPTGVPGALKDKPTSPPWMTFFLVNPLLTSDK